MHRPLSLAIPLLGLAGACAHEPPPETWTAMVDQLSTRELLDAPAGFGNEEPSLRVAWDLAREDAALAERAEAATFRQLARPKPPPQVAIEQRAGRGVKGKAVLTERNKETLVSFELKDSDPGRYLLTIDSGSCADFFVAGVEPGSNRHDLGGPLEPSRPLGRVEVGRDGSGKVRAVVAAPLAALRGKMIVVRESNALEGRGPGGRVVACGAVSLGPTSAGSSPLAIGAREPVGGGS
jgi:hypothetical protein